MAKQQDGGDGPGKGWVQRHETLLVFALMAVSLAILAVFIAPDMLFPASESSITSDFDVRITASGGDIDTATCLANHGIGAGTIVYIYSDTCPASQKNTPWVMSMSAEGRDIFLANTANASAMATVASCLSKMALFEGTPEYVCPSTGQQRSGAFSSQMELDAFAAACK
ncbi:Uncharacterised protein [uncultured archaeon]|nr:Uncharacterised protein [uncultured archaeon]